MGSSKKYKNKLCVYCRKRMSSTADHVFPREMFQVQHRNNLPKVPACKKCNNKKSEIEHYLLSVLPFGGTHNDSKKMLSVDATKRLKNNLKLHNKLRTECGYSYIPRKSKILEQRMFVTFDSNALHSFIGYVCLGLLWHHWQTYLPASHKLKVFTPSPAGIEFLSSLFLLDSPNKVNISLGENTVQYKGSQSEHDKGLSIWAIQLLGGITMSTADHGHIFKNSFVAAITGTSESLNELQFT